MAEANENRDWRIAHNQGTPGSEILGQISTKISFKNSIIGTDLKTGNCRIDEASTLNSKGFNISSDSSCSLTGPKGLAQH